MPNRSWQPAAVIVRSLLVIAILVVSVSIRISAAPPWTEILGAPKATLPAPSAFTSTWRTNLTAGIAEARAQNRPLFVTFRCPTSRQFDDFEKAVLSGGYTLDPLLTQFITVRLTDAAALDLRIFPVEGFQDLDNAWWGWFLSPEGQVYGVFGGRDHVSDASRSSPRGLAHSMQRVLWHHYDERRKSWAIDGPVPELAGKPRTARDLPGYAGWLKWAGPEAKAQGCIYCHQVYDVLREPAVRAGKFDKQRDFEVWPLPENVGLTLDPEVGLTVTEVAVGSPADQAGIKPGAELVAAGGRRLFSMADFRGVLHRAPSAEAIVEVWWQQDGELQSGELLLTKGWRKTVLDWRASVAQGIVGAYPGFFPSPIPLRRRAQLKLPLEGMAVQPFLDETAPTPAYRAGLRDTQVITAVNGESPDVGNRAFLVWFVQHFEPGEAVNLTVQEADGKKREIHYRLPKR